MSGTGWPARRRSPTSGSASPRATSTSKRSDWVDGDTQWFTVKAWRQLADHCRDSLRRADPVVVHGRLSQST